MKNQAAIKHTVINQQYLNIEISDKIAVVTLDNPPFNELKIAMLNNLDNAMKALIGNPKVKVIVITGTERIFSSGADIQEMSCRKSGKHAKAMSSLGQHVFLSIENSPKPVIASINGFCLGGGLELAMSCHMRIASDHSVLGMPEISLGMIPAFGGSFRLTRLIGKSKAIEMILSGRKILSGEALAMGLLDLVVPSETLEVSTRKCAGKWTGKSTVSMRLALRSISLGSNTDIANAMEIEASCIEELYDSHDLREGVHAYLEKRKPDFWDR
jgi:enoyl-CoA hydratase